MNPRLVTLVAERGGWFTRSDAVAAGYADSEIRARLAAGRWRRLCRDAYVDTESEPRDEKPWIKARRQHVLLAAAVQHRTGRSSVLSHQSAVVCHGLPDWSLDLKRVHVSKPAGRARSDKSVVVHKAQLTDDDVTTRGTLRLTRPARAAVEAACASSYETAVVMFDAVLQRGLASRDELAEAVSRLRFRSGSPHAASALEFADERSESVGESRLRVLMANAGLPTPELQAELYDEERRLVGRVDFLFEDQRVIVEFDGETKYADDDGTIILAEKWREDRLRELGYLVIRISWADLARPALTAKRIRQAFARAAAA